MPKEALESVVQIQGITHDAEWITYPRTTIKEITKRLKKLSKDDLELKLSVRFNRRQLQDLELKLSVRFNRRQLQELTQKAAEITQEIQLNYNGFVIQKTTKRILERSQQPTSVKMSTPTTLFKYALAANSEQPLFSTRKLGKIWSAYRKRRHKAYKLKFLEQLVDLSNSTEPKQIAKMVHQVSWNMYNHKLMDSYASGIIRLFKSYADAPDFDVALATYLKEVAALHNEADSCKRVMNYILEISKDIEAPLTDKVKTCILILLHARKHKDVYQLEELTHISKDKCESLDDIEQAFTSAIDCIDKTKLTFRGWSSLYNSAHKFLKSKQQPANAVESLRLGNIIAENLKAGATGILPRIKSASLRHFKLKMIDNLVAMSSAESYEDIAIQVNRLAWMLYNNKVANMSADQVLKPFAAYKEEPALYNAIQSYITYLDITSNDPEIAGVLLSRIMGQTNADMSMVKKVNCFISLAAYADSKRMNIVNLKSISYYAVRCQKESCEELISQYKNAIDTIQGSSLTFSQARDIYFTVSQKINPYGGKKFEEIVMMANTFIEQF